MFIHKFILLVLAVFMVSAANAQVATNRQIEMAAGTVTSVDSVGNTLIIQTQDQKQMAFNVSDKAIVTQQTHDIGLMDIKPKAPVTVQYYVSAPGKYTAVSIVDNQVVSSSGF